MKIIIVGNGSCTINKGELIDKFTNIIRFNLFEIKNFEEYVGTKTTHWIVSYEALINKLNFTKNEQEKINFFKNNNKPNIKKFICFNSFSDYKEYGEELSSLNYEKIIFDNELLKLNDINIDLNNYVLSSGVVTILHFLKQFEKVHITGFTNFLGENIHYFSKTCVNTENHSSEIEKHIINTLIQKGKIEIL